jgi:nucleoside-diphosphate kinase
MNRFFVFIAILVALGVGVLVFYQKKFSQKGLQQTLSLIKPDAVTANKSGLIIAKIEGAGLHVVAMKMTQMTSAEAEQFYAVHKERPFFKSLVEFMSSGPIVAMVLEGENAVASYRTLMGATDPKKADADTLRKEFGTDLDHNAVHGSDSLDNAKKEIAFFFNEDQIYPRTKV